MIAVLHRGGDATRCELCLQPYELKGLLPDLRRTWLLRRYVQPVVLLAVCVISSAVCACLVDSFPMWLLAVLGLSAMAGVCQLLHGFRGWEGFIAGPVLMLLVAMFFGWGLHPPWMATGDAVPELEAGIALSFRRENGRVGGGPFSESIVLLTDYSYSRGAVGYIINKSPRSKADRSGEGLFEGVHQREAKAQKEFEPLILENLPLRLGYGGPVPMFRNGGWEVIHTAGEDTTVRDKIPESTVLSTGVQGSKAVPNLEGVFVGGRRDDLLRELKDGEAAPHSSAPPSPPRAIAVRGYAGCSHFAIPI